ncbi:MAG: tannase/feruloyl esterase family alpha/beta hydrolase [Rhodopila sp.]
MATGIVRKFARALHPLGVSTIALLAPGYEGSAHAAGSPSYAAAVACESLTQTVIRDGTVNTAETISGGTFTPPGSTPITGLPNFCRVTVTMTPTSDSSINVEIWMPAEGWNGRFLATGNGGEAGFVRYDTGLPQGLMRGFAVANTDLGTHPTGTPPETQPDGVTWVGHPERWRDFGYRGNHEQTIAGKAVVAAYYQRPPNYSYFQGCSTGGQQAISLAQQYPADYNGIIAGAAANNRTHLHTMFVWNFKALQQPGAQFDAGQLALISNSVVAACAGKDGGSPADPFLTDPRQCKFDPSTLPRCAAGTISDSCLTDSQFNALETVYEGPVNPRTGQRIYPPMPFGAESSGLGLSYQGDPTQLPSQQLYPFYWTFGADFDYTKFDFDRDMHSVDETLATVLNANDPNLSAFEASGGKLMQYNGTYDGAVPFSDAINYYERAIKLQGSLAQTQDFYRYFLVPGMDHCVGGPGLGHFGQPYSTVLQPDEDHDILLKLVDWVENGNAPEQVLARGYSDASDTTVSLERPICPYPELPVYQGGDRTQASSFLCAKGPRGEVLAPARRYLIGRPAR